MQSLQVGKLEATRTRTRKIFPPFQINQQTGQGRGRQCCRTPEGTPGLYLPERIRNWQDDPRGQHGEGRRGAKLATPARTPSAQGCRHKRGQKRDGPDFLTS